MKTNTMKIGCKVPKATKRKKAVSISSLARTNYYRDRKQKGDCGRTRGREEGAEAEYDRDKDLSGPQYGVKDEHGRRYPVKEPGPQEFCHHQSLSREQNGQGSAKDDGVASGRQEAACGKWQQASVENTSSRREKQRLDISPKDWVKPASQRGQPQRVVCDGRESGLFSCAHA
jgi:hypothetical protein